MNRILFTVILLIALIAVSASAQQSPSSPAQNPARATSENKSDQPRLAGSIEGRVTSDDGQPLGNLQVYAGQLGIFRGVSRTVGTNDEGKFVLNGLAPGTYSIFARTPGYILAEYQAEPKRYRPGDNVDLTMTKGGVITGTVTRSTGEPVVAVRVSAILVRDIEGRPVSRPVSSGLQYTDDRGVYRLYGLRPGLYLVVAGSSSGFYSGLSAEYEDDTRTYFPSATRDTAAEVTVASGQEATGIDIQYRGEQGRSVSGVVSGKIPPDRRSGFVSLVLTHAASGFIEGTANLPVMGNDNSFAFHGVPDGEYEVIARSSFSTGEGAASPPFRVTVRGADVTGLELKLAPLGRVAGRVVLETQQAAASKTACKDERKSLLEESIITARSDENKERKDRPQSASSSSIISAPDSKGQFLLRNLYAARYHMVTELPNRSWYIRAITRPGAGGRLTDVARNGFALKSGEQVKDMTITVAEGAASFSGRVVPSTEGERLPDRLHVHLVPVETERADDTLRFAETAVRRDGAFAFDNIAPGRYRLLIFPIPDEEPSDRATRPLAWDADGRASLRRQIESATTEIELQPCQRATDNILRFVAPSPQNSRPPEKNL
ncbi:MAG: carboxypeptidase-like regulatory domain-containing protein [Blastocatellia bacterium]|nr:carboxypeptidase-like regulatory domain-containing protein [Blastocatellia bacterium]